MSKTREQLKDELKSIAGRNCIDIFNDYEWAEVKSLSPSIVHAWETGRALVELFG